MLRIFSSAFAGAGAAAEAGAGAVAAAGLDAAAVTGSSFLPQATKAEPKAVANNKVIQKCFFIVLMQNAGNESRDCMKILPQIQFMKTGSPYIE